MGGGRRAGGLGYVGLVFRRVHFTLFGGQEVRGRSGRGGSILGPSGAGRAGGVSGGVVVPTVGAVGGGGGAAIGDGADVAIFGAGGVGAAVLRFPVVESADRADGVVVLAYWGGVAVPLTVAATGGFVGGVGDFDLPLTREKENVGAYLPSFLGGGGDHHRGGVLEGAGVRVRVKKAGGSDCKAFGIEDGCLEVDK